MMSTYSPARLLDPHLPLDDQDVLGLLIKQRAVLGLACTGMLGELTAPSRLPAVLVGPAGSGKSHLLRCLSRCFAPHFSCVVQVPVAGGVDDVLRQLLRGMATQIKDAEPHGRAAFGDAMMQLYEEPISGRAQNNLSTAAVSSLITNLLALDNPAESALRNLLAGKASAAPGQVAVAPFDRPELLALIRLLHNAMRSERPSWRALLCIDDFDQIHRDRVSGSLHPLPLLQVLVELARLPGLHVLTTARDLTHARRPRAFTCLASMEPLAPVDVAAVYERRFAYYAVPPPLQHGFVMAAACDSQGSPGLLLHFLDLIYRSRRHLPPLIYPSSAAQLWQRFAAQHPTLASSLHGGTVNPVLVGNLRGTPLWSLLLEEPNGDVSLRPFFLGFARTQGAPAIWTTAGAQQPLSAPAAAPPALGQGGQAQQQAHAALAAGRSAFLAQRRGDAEREIRRAVTLYRQGAASSRVGEGQALLALGALLLRDGRLSEARDAYRDALDTARQAGDRAAASRSTLGLGDVALRSRPLDLYLLEAEDYYTLVAADPVCTAAVQLRRALLSLQPGHQRPDAKDLLDVVLAQGQANNADEVAEVAAGHALGLLALGAAAVEDARRELEAARVGYQRLRDQQGEAIVLADLADLASLDSPLTAVRRGEEATALAIIVGDLRSAARGQLAAAVACCEMGDAGASGRHLGEVASRLVSLGYEAEGLHSAQTSSLRGLQQRLRLESALALGAPMP